MKTKFEVRRKLIIRLATIALELMCTLPVARSLAQPCALCPAEATGSAAAASLNVHVIRNINGVPTDLTVNQGTVGSSETLFLVSQAIYSPDGGVDPVTGRQKIAAGNTGGQGLLTLPNGTVTNITPADMGTTVVGPTAPGSFRGTPYSACTVIPGATEITDWKEMKVVSYMLTQTDIAAGSAVFTFEYSDGLSLLPSANGVCNLKVSVSLQESVSIAAPPSATVNPATNSACPGSSPSFTVAAVGSGPFAYSWSGPNGFVSTNATITITNAEAVNAGVYTATVTDPFGCSTTCSGTLIYCSPQFTNLTILGSDLILSGSGGTPSATYTVLAANNLTASPSNWVAIGTSNFDSGGQFNFTNPIDFKERFFRLRIP